MSSPLALLATGLISVSLPGVAEAQYPAARPTWVAQRPAYYAPSYRPVANARPPVVQAAPAPVAARPAVAAQPVAAQPAAEGDPYGFTAWLNGVRASYGLGPVGYDPNLASWAAVNNSHQNSRGMGHFVMGPARRQNSAMGSSASIGPMWLNSPAHRSAMLDPSVRWVGLAGSGSYWTLNLR